MLDLRACVVAVALFGALLGCCIPCPPNPQPVSTTCNLSNADFAALEAVHSSARVWDELALNAIRRALPQPTTHARNLYHLSAAMFDAWASFDGVAQGVFSSVKTANVSVDAQAQAVSFAAYRVLKARYASDLAAVDCLNIEMSRAGLDASNAALEGDSAVAVGNRAAKAVLDGTMNDGAGSPNDFTPANAPLQPEVPGISMREPDHWQPLLLAQPFTQNGIQQPVGPQPFMGANWRNVRPFAMTRSGALYHDPGPAPSEASAEMRERWLLEVLRKQSQMDASSSETIDISPGAMGNNSLGANDGKGYAQNPVTNKSYAPEVVKLADFGRVIAEFWADGPRSETPPGHWNVIANAVADSPGFERRLGGAGAQLPPLEWDVKVYLALNGALHDAAITAWEIKRVTSTARPISLVRYMADVDPRGLPITPGLIENRDGLTQVRGWQGGFFPARAWVPYQSGNFVTPAFPGFVSGHSTFSRAAAEVLADLTGSAFFPGGLLETPIQSGFLRIDPLRQNAPITLQWATYYDAADQAGQSRVWGGIHIEPDDLTGRRLGRDVGLDAVKLARRYFFGTR